MTNLDGSNNIHASNNQTNVTFNKGTLEVVVETVIVEAMANSPLVQ